MSELYRGTTPCNIFITALDLSEAEVVYLTYSQNGMPVIEKDKSQLTFGYTTETDPRCKLTVTLTQEDTLKFDKREIEIQIRARFSDGRAVASKIITASAERVLKDGVI